MHRFRQSKKVLSYSSLAVVSILSLALSSIFLFTHHQAAHAAGTVITNVNTDKARYNPGDSVTIWVDLTNATGSSISNGSVTLYFQHLDQQVSNPAAKTLNLASGATTTLSWTWTPPATDFQGYQVQAWVRDSGNTVLDNYNTAVDVSSDWKKFPRYGYMSDYPAQNGSVSTNLIWQLKNYHIDALQFYDWQDRHHVPLAGTTANPDSQWQDVGKRDTYRQTVLDYLNAAHSYNILGFNYNAANAAYENYASDGSGVDPAWAIYNNNNCTNQDGYNLNSSFETNSLKLFDPGNTAWQNYIAAKESDAFAAYPFDGEHVDQLVSNGNPYRCNGSQFNIYGTFASFLNSQKARINKRFIFNSYGRTAGEDVSKNTSNDAMYYEWYSDRRYWDMLDDVETTRGWTTSKQVIEAVYMDQSHTGSNFGTSGVLLADASIFAAGGDHIELGQGNHMLDSGYFPDKSLQLSADLQRRLRNYYDFVVAYENLLRDGLTLSNQYGTNLQLSAGGNSLAVSPDSQPNTVYKITRSGNGYDTINLINCLGINSTDIFDTNGDKPAPTAQSNVTVKYYYTGSVTGVSWASPDYQNGKSASLTYTTGSDSTGTYVTFTVPSLEYWDLIYLHKGQSTAGQQLFSDDFESGNANQWSVASGSWSVCQVGSNSKEYCGSNTSENISLAGSTSWTNYSVQSYVVATSAATNTGISLLGRVQDSSHFYQAELKDGTTWDIYKNNGGTWTQIATGTYSWSGGSYTLLKFVLNGQSLSLYYSTNFGSSWNLLGSGNDTSWSGGKIGVRVWGTSGRFDQVGVTSY